MTAENKKVYVVTADTYQDSWGSTEELFLVTLDGEQAEEVESALHNKGYLPKVSEVILNEETRVYLGGYIE